MVDRVFYWNWIESSLELKIFKFIANWTDSLWVDTSDKLEKKRNTRLNTLKKRAVTHFTRQERLYTKLKYSRSPAYDTVSGGLAVLLSGLIGFLISEKFGFELVDCGDFYFFWMYVVFIAFALKPILITLKRDLNVNYILSIKRVINFYITVFTILKLNICSLIRKLRYKDL